MHCWKDKTEHMAELHGFGSQEWAAAMADGGGTCLLDDGHDGPHKFTPDSNIEIEFPKDEPGVRLDIFGYFDTPESDVPAHDPGMAAPCIVCMKPLAVPVMTISLTPIGNARSYFFRAHRDCWRSCSSDEKTKYESSLVDALVNGQNQELRGGAQPSDVAKQGEQDHA